MFFISPTFCKTLLLLILTCLFAGACSSGGSSSSPSNEPKGGIPEISISPIQGLQPYYEGDTVRLSLRVEGEVAGKLNFVWSLPSDIEFQGQGTRSITFVAPEVDGIRVLSILVEVDLEGGTLLGDGSRMGAIQVLDLAPPSILADGFKTHLPKVQNLNLAMIDDSELLAVDTFQRSELELAGQLMEAQRVWRNSGNIVGTAAEPNVKLCGEVDARPLETLIAPDLECDGAGITREYYQSGAELRSETYCGNEIIYAANIRGINVDPQARKGQVLFSVDDTERLQDSVDACFERVDVLLSLYDETLSSPMKYISEEASRYRIEVPQADGPVIFDVSGGEIVSTYASFSLDHFFNEGGRNAVVIIAPNDPVLDGLKADDGSVDIVNLDENEYEIKMRLYFEDDNGVRKWIQSDSMLYLP